MGFLEVLAGGEAIDLLESKLKDGGFKFSFDPIRIKFSPNKPKIKELEEIGTHFAGIIKSKKNQEIQILKYHK